jgi:LysM repeat protein
MGFTAGPAVVRSPTSAILIVVALFALACVALAAPGDFSERDLTPPPRARPAKSARQPAKRVQPAAYSDEQAAQQDTDDETSDEGQPENAPAASASGNPSNEGPFTGDLSYEIHEGDSVGAVAGMFHIPAQEIFRRNHLNENSMLHVGQILRIPNPYATQLKSLQSQINTLQSTSQEQSRKLQDNNAKERALSAKIEELSGINRSMEHDITMLPWWRRATTLAVTLALVMLGISLVSLVQWFLIRQRFLAIAGANEKLTKLDQRYRVLLARTELRLQQLYGRRRAPEFSPQAKNPEDFELERLGREVKEVLERELSRLGMKEHAPVRRSRFREWLTNLGSPVAVRSDRR